MNWNKSAVMSRAVLTIVALITMCSPMAKANMISKEFSIIYDQTQGADNVLWGEGNERIVVVGDQGEKLQASLDWLVGEEDLLQVLTAEQYHDLLEAVMSLSLFSYDYQGSSANEQSYINLFDHADVVEYLNTPESELVDYATLYSLEEGREWTQEGYLDYPLVDLWMGEWNFQLSEEQVSWVENAYYGFDYETYIQNHHGQVLSKFMGNRITIIADICDTGIHRTFSLREPGSDGMMARIRPVRVLSGYQVGQLLYVSVSTGGEFSWWNEEFQVENPISIGVEKDSRYLLYLMTDQEDVPFSLVEAGLGSLTRSEVTAKADEVEHFGQLGGQASISHQKDQGDVLLEEIQPQEQELIDQEQTTVEEAPSQEQELIDQSTGHRAIWEKVCLVGVILILISGLWWKYH